MSIAFTAFGIATLNVFGVLASAVGFVSREGVLALELGAGRQIIGLGISVYLGMLCYSVFKAFEQRVVSRINRWHMP